MKFNQLFQLLFESFDFSYEIPIDKKLLLFDFYTLNFIAKNSESTDQNYLLFRTETEDVYRIIKETEEKLLPFLKKELLNVVYEAISTEFHMTVTKSRTLQEFCIKEAKDHFGYKGLKRNYANIGGEAWANICEGWLKLNNISDSNISELYIWIDHVYDLQHNTGIIFDKIDDYYIDNSVEWIKNALDLKRDVINPWILVRRSSKDMQKLAAKVLHISGLGSLEENI